MSEEVNTGGITSIRHKKGEKFELEEERSKSIDDAYLRASERKKKEKRAWIELAIGFILILLIVAYFYFSR